MTLIELVVVVAILAVLAMIILPKLDGLQGVANHAVGASSATDAAKYIQTYRAQKLVYPDGWDSLTDGTNLWQAGYTATKTRGLHPQLGTGSNPKLQVYTLTTDDVTGLISSGISTLYNVSGTHASNSTRPSDAFISPVTLTTSGGGNYAVAIVNETSANGKKIIDRVYRDNIAKGTNGLFYNAASTTVTGRHLMAVGLGPQNTMVGKLMLEAGYYPNVDLTYVYGRNLALFEIGGSSRAIFKGVIGADGDLLDDLTTYVSRDVQ
jgi:type II secretory pathway pseudopilin PulG